MSQLSDERSFITSATERELHPRLPPQAPWTHCVIDLVCNLPIISKGFCHILSLYAISKYVAALTLKNMTTREVLDKLQEIYLTYVTVYVISARSEFEGGDLILVQNI